MINFDNPIAAPSGPDHSYLDSLNPAQREAVERLDGPLLVLAGAGTGKTKVLTTRLGHLLNTGKAHASQILTVTFTNKAAQEMKRRVMSMLGADGAAVEGWWLGTFHSLCARMLRRHAELAGLRSNFTILDEDDQLRLLKQLMEAENIDVKKSPPRAVSTVIQRWKDRALTPDHITPADAGALADGKLANIYRDYQERLRTLNACDFGDLLMHIITILRDPNNADLLAKYQRQFKYILVDEYQDTNVAQYMWLRLLAQGKDEKNICCVGDDDQSIYGWRGAEIGNILRFEQDFPGAHIVRLEQNYRSTPHILNAANAVITNNKGRLGKNLWSAEQEGEKLQLRGVWDGKQEATFVAEEIERLQHRRMSLSDMAIIVRTASQTRAFEERFLTMGIPYRVFSGLRFYERQEIRDAIAYLRVIAQPDDDLAFERIINVPKRGIGPAATNKIHLVARARKTSLTRALDAMLDSDEFSGKTRTTLTTLHNDFARWRGLLKEMSHVEVAQIMLDESGYTAMWQADKTPEAAGRLENLKEFITALNEFENLDAFLEHVALVMENDENNNDSYVSLMTFHAAKGLEYKIVFLPGWEEGLFPSQRALDETGMSGLEEERRLAYVGITRARERAYISFAANRLIYGSWTSSLPSRFIEELPRDEVETVIDPGLAAGAQQGFGGGFGNRGGGFGGRQQRFIESSYDIDSISVHQASEGGFAPNQRVFHQKFGYGTVVAADTDKLDILFDSAGRKKVLDSFVTAADAV